MSSSSTTTVPTPIKWAKGLAIFQIILGLLTIAFLLWAFNSGPTTTLVSEMINGLGGQELENYTFFFTTPEGIGYLLGVTLPSFLGPIFAILAISRRSKAWAITSLIFNGLNFISGYSLATLAIIIFMLQKSSRDYLNFSKS
jgi:hypothetical protein